MDGESLLRLVWAKTWRPRRGEEKPPGAEWHSLPAHAVDSAHSAGWVWDTFLSPGVRSRLAGGLEEESARASFVWLAALHDFGKLTLEFQGLNTGMRRLLAAAGVRLRQVPRPVGHAWWSCRLVFELLTARGWPTGAAMVVALTLGGHHGKFPEPGWERRRVEGAARRVGLGVWEGARDALFGLVDEVAGAAQWLEEWARAAPLPVAWQLVRSGAVSVADWLASNEELFPYEGEFPSGYRALSASRVGRAGEVMGLSSGWGPDLLAPVMGAGAFYRSRFGREPRPVQRLAYELAVQVSGPGMTVAEAPMGVGKTELALAVSEVLAARFGANGVFFGLPTQATANGIFPRVLEWLEKAGTSTTVALAHGKAARQKDYRALLAVSGGSDAGCGADVMASRWSRGRYRALLMPVVVATVDQLLLAGLATRYVSVRMLGLAGKVVVLDEVHAYDAYMSGVLGRLLAWLGRLGVPVVLLSATLSSGQRAELASAYAGRTVELDGAAAYPRLTWVDAPQTATGDGHRTIGVEGAPGASFTVEYLPAPVRKRADTAEEVAVVAARVLELARAGERVLVVRNTVSRAQELADELRSRIVEQALCDDGGEGLTLMHARFTGADRSRLETELVERFGPEGTQTLPHIVVATQVVEQSLNISFDVLVTDLCPIDLLFQRLGRIHRFDLEPRKDLCVVVTGFEERAGLPPAVPSGSRTVYGHHLLWRTKAALDSCQQLELPQDIPVLVDQVYRNAPVGPASWQEAMAEAAADAEAERSKQVRLAKAVALKSPDSVTSLEDLHAEQPVSGDDDEGNEQVQMLVRLGKPSLEVILLRHGAEPGTAITVSHGKQVVVPLNEPPLELVETVLDQAVRLPSWSEALTAAARGEAERQPGWADLAWLSDARVLLLPADGSPLPLAGFLLNYDPRNGLSVTSTPAAPGSAISALRSDPSREEADQEGRSS